MSTETTHFVVLGPDDSANYYSAGGGSLRDAIRAHIPDLTSQGHGRLRMWFVDDMSDPALRYNGLADGVLTRLRYRHPSGWYGPVALSLEAPGPLSPEIRETLDEAIASVRDEAAADADPFAAALAVPALVPLVHDGTLMHMGSATADGRVVQAYKHCDTRRYVFVDAHGQTWAIRTTPTGDEAQRISLGEALATLLALDDPTFWEV